MSLGHMLANNNFRQDEIRKERRAAYDSSSAKDNLLEYGGATLGATAGGTLGAVHKELDNVKKLKQGLPVSDSVWSNRTGLGVGLGLLAGVGAGRMLQGENEERDAHRARIKELRGMDQDTLTKERVRSLQKQASELSAKELDKYRKDEIKKSFQDAQDSVTNEEKWKRLGGSLTGSALGTVGGIARRRSKDIKRLGYTTGSKFQQMGSKEAIIGSLAGSIAGDITGGLLANKNEAKEGHLKRLKDVSNMTHAELLEDQKAHMQKAASAFYALQEK